MLCYSEDIINLCANAVLDKIVIYAIRLELELGRAGRVLLHKSQISVRHMLYPYFGFRACRAKMYVFTSIYHSKPASHWPVWYKNTYNCHPLT